MKIWLVVLSFFVSNIIFAQGKYDANWVFGIKAGINFNDTANPINFNTLCNEDYTAASISDSLGNLLFYISPDVFSANNVANHTLHAIFNGNNEIINSGDSLNVGSDLQDALFLPVPQTPNSYYLFYMNQYEDDNLLYAIITFDSSTSTYTVTQKNKILNASSLETGIAAVKHANGNDWWLVVHQSDSIAPTDTFYEYLITKDSIQGPYAQGIGSLHTSLYVTFSELTFSKNGSRLTCSLEDQNGIDLFNFDRCSGQLKDFIPLTNVDTTGIGQIESCEFSSDGSKLYASEGGGDINSKSALYQFDLTAANINSSETILYSTDSAQTTFGDLLRAPDDKIYLAVEYNGYAPYYNHYNQFNSYLWVINNPDSAGMACNFQPYGYFLGDTLNDSARVYWGLPNMPNYNLGALSIYQGIGYDTTICNTDSIIIGNPPVANVTYSWQSTKGITDTTLAQQTLKPDSSTWYYVTLTDTTINYSCQSVTDSFYVQVVHCCDSALLSQCTLSKDTFICTDEDTPSKGAVLFVDTVPGVSFAWQPAAGISVHSTQQIVDPSQSAWYYVTFFSDSDSSLACNKRLDSVFVKVETCMGIEEVSAATQHLNIYPNPAQNTAVVEWSPIDGQLQLSVADLLGREIQILKVDGIAGKTQIDISGLSNGLYVVRLMFLTPGRDGGVGGGSGKLTVIK